jgi:uncharacterized protein involved in exopolysaccharide biosynthesis
MTPSDDSEQVGLREYVLQLWARKWVIALVFVLAVGGTLGYCVISTAKYSGTSELLLTPTLSPTLLEANGAFTQNQLVDVPSDSQVISSAVLRGIVSQSIPDAPKATVTQIGTTDVVQISTTSTEAATAAAAANDYAHDYITFEQSQTEKTLNAGIKLVNKHIGTVQLAIANLNTKISAATTAGAAAGFESQLNILNEEFATLNEQLANYQSFSSKGGGNESGQIISFASVPTKTSSPKTIEWTVIAALIGIVLGVGAAMLVEALAAPPKVVRSTDTRTVTKPESDS